MLTKNFERLKSEVADHVKADRVTQGSYKTCFIGCLANGHDDPGFIQRTYGIPVMVTRIAEEIFEGLPADEAPDFFAALPEAVGSDGKDLTRVGWKLLAAELRALPPVSDDIQAVIDPVIEGMDLLADGKEWPEAAVTNPAYWSVSAAVNAANRATFAARAARAARATDSSFAAWSVAYAAAGSAAACLRQRDTLLRLIKEALITQKEDL